MMAGWGGRPNLLPSSVLCSVHGGEQVVPLAVRGRNASRHRASARDRRPAMSWPSRVRAGGTTRCRDGPGHSAGGTASRVARSRRSDRDRILGARQQLDVTGNSPAGRVGGEDYAEPVPELNRPLRRTLGRFDHLAYRPRWSDVEVEDAPTLADYTGAAVEARAGATAVAPQPAPDDGWVARRKWVTRHDGSAADRLGLPLAGGAADRLVLHGR
jgi:hypothetical protein